MSPRIKYVPITKTSTTTEITVTTTTTMEEITIMSSTEPIDITTKYFEHANEMIITTESTLESEESNQTNNDYSSSTFASIPSTMISFEATTLGEEITSTETEYDYMTTNQANNEEQTNFSTVSTNVNEEESSTVSISSNQPRLFHLLANLYQHMTTEYPISEDFNSTIIENTTTTTSE